MKRTRKLTDKKQLSFVKYKDLSSCNETRQEVVAAVFVTDLSPSRA